MSNNRIKLTQLGTIVNIPHTVHCTVYIQTLVFLTGRFSSVNTCDSQVVPSVETIQHTLDNKMVFPHCEFLTCFFILLDWVNDLLHSEHLKGFSSVWIIIWYFRLCACANDLEHSKHLKGFSLVWILICARRCPATVKDLTHIEHLKGFSPVWILIWTFRLPGWLNDLVHSKHL